MNLVLVILAITIPLSIQQSQNLDDYRIDEGFNRCYYCLASEKLTMYMKEKPVCEIWYGDLLYKPAQLQDIKQYECYDFKGEDIYYN